MTWIRSIPLMKKATAIRLAINEPIQNALKFPATMPERIVRDAPPSRDAVTISCTCLEWELVKTLVNSGMRTAARVPQLMMTASFHQRPEGPSWTTEGISPMSSQLMKNEVEMLRIEAIQMR